MEYARALGTIIFDESCHLWDLTEVQIGRNQFTVDVAVDCLDERINEVDGRVDHVLERLSVLEGKVMDMEAGYTKLLALGWEQVEMSARSCQALANLAAVAVAQQQKIREAECHRHGRLAQLSLNSSFISLSPTLHTHSLILSLFLSYLFTRLYLILLIISQSLSHIPYLSFKCAGLFYDDNRNRRITIYS